MIDTVLFYTHYIILLAFGILLSFSFAGVRFAGKFFFSMTALFVFCLLTQFVFFNSFGEEIVWKFYPAIVHLPLILVLVLIYKKRFITACASVCLAYLCCQPAKWFGYLALELTDKVSLEYPVRILILLLVGIGCIFTLSTYISELFNKEDKGALVFGIVPIVYYLFEYVMGIYTPMLERNSPIATEFLPLFLCVFFMIFCVVYYKEYEKKADAQRNEQIMRVTVQQQAKEIEAVKASHMEARLLRHDMRLVLSSLALSIEQNDRENALNIISGFVDRVDASAIHRFCENDTLNYVLTGYETKCRENEIRFDAIVEIGELRVDEAMFASIISNALDNALNAQASLLPSERNIKLMLKDSDGKLLLSVKNPFKGKIVFADGLPVSNKKGHGLGTQSIRYVAEKLGGKSQFSVKDDKFVLRVILQSKSDR